MGWRWNVDVNWSIGICAYENYFRHNLDNYFNAQGKAVMVLFLLGVLVGGSLGILLMAIFAIGKREDNTNNLTTNYY